jgi:hypothetical protein
MDSLSLVAEIASQWGLSSISVKKNKAGDKMAKAMRYENPIVAVKQVEAKNEEMAYTENIVSFQ